MEYNSTTNNVNNSVEDAVLIGVLEFLNKSNTKVWTGTMTTLRKQLIKTLGRNANLPGSPSALRVVLNRVVNKLRSRKVGIRFGRTTDHMRTRFVKFTTK